MNQYTTLGHADAQRAQRRADTKLRVRCVRSVAYFARSADERVEQRRELRAHGSGSALVWELGKSSIQRRRTAQNVC